MNVIFRNDLRYSPNDTTRHPSPRLQLVDSLPSFLRCSFTSPLGVNNFDRLIMTSAKQYHLRITAGSSYDLSTHHIVPVNTSTPLTIDSPHITTDLSIRIASFRGLSSSSPSTSPYFEHDPHKADRYSIQFDFKLKEENISGTDLVFGNDFEKRTFCSDRCWEETEELTIDSHQGQTSHWLRNSISSASLGYRSRS
jgi:hypothetical protein